MTRKLGSASIVFTLLVLAVLAACSGGKDSASAPTSNTYTSTTSRGDLVNYTITGSNAAIQWNVTDNVGAINYTWNVAATCGALDTTYGYRDCTIASASCAAGAVACPTSLPSGTIQLMEMPGTALIVHVPAAVAAAADGSTHEELHAGFISGGCPSDVSGDYAFIMTGHANAASSGENLFGIYRSDATFNNVTHADFGMITAGTDSLNTAVAKYATNPGNPGGAETLIGTTCQNGVFTRTLSGSTMRLNITSGGSLIIDMPADQGGLISFKTSSAATLADIASHNWWGLTFPDNGSAEPFNLTTKAVAAGAVSADVLTTSGGSSLNIPIKPATGGAALTPANKFAAPAAYTSSGNALQLTYAAPGNIPGLFLIDEAPDSKIVAIASKVGTQVMLYGVVFNFRDAAGAGCMEGSAGCIPRNSGNFIAFTH